ncbi:unnamed protein product [Linum tenue]|uniref:Uncharacterized protein n=1 Tax=Linum tenue TaxID=586396 RepID=A0AAV0LHV9_9ROSI|nr:unnamed protein product [Linum tenue]CAI0433785.1 unnamed protein product [Linum tenue]
MSSVPQLIASAGAPKQGTAPPAFGPAAAAATYLPTLWVDHDFLTLKCEHASTVELQHEELKKQVRKMLNATAATVDQACQKLRLIDAVQRLGLGYHFESEIEAELSNMMMSSSPVSESVANDLNSAALWFRLLRQQGFHNFKDGEGNFKSSWVSDVPAMLSLYEASFLAIPGEDVLDQALAFTTQNLIGSSSSSAAEITSSTKLAEEVSFALNRPIRKRLQRVEARRFIDTYQANQSHDGSLLRLAQLDFNIVQQQHQEELRGIQEWWGSLDVTTNFPYARDRIVECYFWIMGVYFEPKYRLARRLLTKFIAIMSLTDDTYDNYATAEQLEVLTQAIERWDINLISGLPGSIKMLYGLFVYIFDEFEQAVSGEGRSFGVRYVKRELDNALKAFLMEARWRDANYFPKLEEYMQVSLGSTCYSLLAAVSFIGMAGADAATEEAFQWISGEPQMLVASSTVCRLMDDILEQERNHIPSAIECYMEKHKVAEEAVVVELFRERVADAWKDINKEFMRPTAVAAPLLDRILNLTRAIDVIYKDADTYTDSYLLKDHVVSILKEPVRLH